MPGLGATMRRASGLNALATYGVSFSGGGGSSVSGSGARSLVLGMAVPFRRCREPCRCVLHSVTVAHVELVHRYALRQFDRLDVLVLGIVGQHDPEATALVGDDAGLDGRNLGDGRGMQQDVVGRRELLEG